MLNLYADFARQPSRLGQGTPAIGEIVDGTQQLKEDVAANVMTFLQTRYFPPPTDMATLANAQAVEYTAVTPAKLISKGYQLEGYKNAAQQLGELGAQYLALANVNDTMVVLGAVTPTTTGDEFLYRIRIVDSRAAAQTFAQPGSDWAVLKPRLGAGGMKAAAEEKKGLSTATIVGALVGAGVGFVVGGPVGALVGGLAVGAIVNSQAAWA